VQHTEVAAGIGDGVVAAVAQHPLGERRQRAGDRRWRAEDRPDNLRRPLSAMLSVMTTRPVSDARPARLVDSHVHFWDRSAEGLEWPMLEEGFPYPLHRFDTGRFAAQEFRAETAGTNVTKVVHVQAAATPDPENESAWLQRMADRHGWPNGIVGRCDLAADDAPAVVEAHARYSNFRGVRDPRASAKLGTPGFDRGVRALAAHDARCDLTARWPLFDAVLEAARRHPGVLFVLEHAGSPDQRTDSYFADWSSHLRRLAAADNVVCKVSGLALGDPEWTVPSLRRWVLESIDAFGTHRCLFGSNWPVDKLYGTWDEMIAAFCELVGGFSADERDALFAGNAEGVYRI
jgi:predicted TIM-barrel fold metal-dependent hydrolase